ncbi:hypothetical protein CGLO_10523 [Colletotrichum gloeosporioides Cg-14]|uniref:Uncharacterized protein n=1 Tax=Colletotrichum gloeosporioides (strain Cg-14) TaxID=1237896 RepID=T0LET4_COLGC|nr:hypothetical protein CGLO_10523 [Colletotrichum gloeosporioides Cg-14]
MTAVDMADESAGLMSNASTPC